MAMEGTAARLGKGLGTTAKSLNLFQYSYRNQSHLSIPRCECVSKRSGNPDCSSQHPSFAGSYTSRTSRLQDSIALI